MRQADGAMLKGVASSLYWDRGNEAVSVFTKATESSLDQPRRGNSTNQTHIDVCLSPAKSPSTFCL